MIAVVKRRKILLRNFPFFFPTKYTVYIKRNNLIQLVFNSYPWDKGSVYPDFQFWHALIRASLLLEGILLEIIAVAL